MNGHFKFQSICQWSIGISVKKWFETICQFSVRTWRSKDNSSVNIWSYLYGSWDQNMTCRIKTENYLSASQLPIRMSRPKHDLSVKIYYHPSFCQYGCWDWMICQLKFGNICLSSGRILRWKHDGLINKYMDLAKPKSGAPRLGCSKPD